MVAHGWGKLTRFNELSAQFPDPLGVGPVFSLGLCIFAEFFCAGLITFGFFTRFAVIPLIINMGVAALVIHGADPFQKKEMALLYLAAFVAIGLLGPGKYSLGKSDKV